MRIAVLLAGALLAPVLLTAQDSAQEQRPTGIFYLENGPRLASTAKPECTEEAIQAQLRDVVSVSVQINQQGEPARLEVVESPGYGLGPKALEAISQWRWRVAPGQIRSEDGRIDATVQMSFQCKVLPPMNAN